MCRGLRTRQAQTGTETTPDDFSGYSLPALLGDLANLVLNRVRLPTQHKTAITGAIEPTQLQRQAFGLLGVDPAQTVTVTG